LALTNNRMITVAQQEIKGTALAKESMEQIFAIKQESWAALGNLDEGHYLIRENGSNYELYLPSDPAHPEEEIDGNFHRKITISKGYRDSDGEISDSGQEDPNTRRIDVTVSWNELGNPREINLTGYLTNWKGQ